MKSILAGCLCITIAAPSLALPSAPSPGFHGPITRQQAIGRADRLFDLLDVNHDGVLTRLEAEVEGARLRAERAASGVDVAPGVGGHTARFMERRFAGLRSITRDQLERAMLAHFDAMDRDHDGILTADERDQ